MTAIKLYKFIAENEVGYHLDNDKVIIFISDYLIEDFKKLFTSGIFDDKGIGCIMQQDYFCFEMKYICEYYGIELKEIFDKD